MSAVFTEDDIGKAVETDAGEVLGVVVDVDPETAYVEPTEGTADSTSAVLDWEGSGDEAVPLTDAAVDRVTDEAVRLESDFSPESITSGSTDEGERPDEGGADTDTATDPDDVDYAPGEPVASNPTEPETDADGASGVGETGDLDGGEPMMADDEFYDETGDEARVDPDDEMESPDEDETVPPTEYDESEAAADAEGTTAAADATDRDDVDVDPDEVTAGEPEAEIGDEEDVK